MFSERKEDSVGESMAEAWIGAILGDEKMDSRLLKIFREKSRNIEKIPNCSHTRSANSNATSGRKMCLRI